MASWVACNEVEENRVGVDTCCSEHVAGYRGVGVGVSSMLEACTRAACAGRAAVGFAGAGDEVNYA